MYKFGQAQSLQVRIELHLSELNTTIDKTKPEDPVKALEELKTAQLKDLFSTVIKDGEIKQWFEQEYCEPNLDIMILYLDHLKKQNVKIDFLLNIPNPQQVTESYFFNYKENNALAEMAMMQEMMMLEGEGEDDMFDEEDLDIEKIKAIAKKKQEVPEKIVELQNHAKSVIQSLWDKVLRASDIDNDTILKILKAMNTKIFPKVANPILFSDFLISAYDLVDTVGNKTELSHKDIVISIHALSSLFILLANHGLDYTSINYYTKLYSLLNYLQNIFRMKEKEKFLKLLELSLKSPMLPSAIAASFIKKVLRMIITQYIEQAST